MPAKSRKTATSSTAKSLDDFRKTHDKSYVIPEKIKAGLAKLGKDGWEYENEFIRTCGLSQTDFSRFRNQFEGYFLLIGGRNHPKRVWAGSKALVEKLTEMAQ